MKDLYSQPLFINEPLLGHCSLGLFECIVNHKQKEQDSDTSQEAAETNSLLEVEHAQKHRCNWF